MMDGNNAQMENYFHVVDYQPLAPDIKILFINDLMGKHIPFDLLIWKGQKRCLQWNIVH